EQGHLYDVDVHDMGFYILSNKGADNRRILFSNTIPASVEACDVVTEHSPEVLIEDIHVMHSHLVISERSNGLQQIKLLNLNDGAARYISMEEETYALGLSYNDNYHADYVYYRYNSMTTPPSVYKYSFGDDSKSMV